MTETKQIDLPSSNPHAFTYTILYYQGRALGELPRFIARAGKLKLVNDFITDDTFHQIRESLLFGQIPRLNVTNEAGELVVELVQSRAIARYLATLTNFAGKTPEENAEIDQMYEGIQSINEELGRAWWSENRRFEVNEFLRGGKLQESLQKFDDIVSCNEAGVLAGKGMSWADFSLFIFLEDVLVLAGEDSISTHTNLIELMEKIKALPNVKEYLEDPDRPKSYYEMPEARLKTVEGRFFEGFSFLRTSHS